MQETPPKKLGTDFVDDMRLEVALTELGEHLEFDRENIYVKERYHEVYLADNDDGDPAEFKMTTKERKALDREIPYLMIPENQRDNYAAALGKEWANWLRFGAVRVLSISASQAAQHQYPKARFLASRVCYRDKNAAMQTDEVAAKARIVARGDRDPDLLALRRDAPTMARTGFYVVLNIIAAFHMTVFGGDIARAFMQGLQELAQRDLQLFLT